MRLIRIHILCFLMVGITTSVMAQEQKIGFFESDIILEKIPEYTGIEQRLKQLSDTWNAQIRELDKAIEELELDFQAKEILYTDEIRLQKRNEINQKKRERDAFLNQKFGPEGEFFRSQKDLLEPLQRQIFAAVRQVAQRQGFDFVFDRSGDIYMVYARSEWNLNSAIFLELGIEVDDFEN